MSQEVKVPELGEGIESAQITSVLVGLGDIVKAEQPLVEVESEKAALEIPASVGGKVKEIRVQSGEQIQVGQVLLVLDVLSEQGPKEASPATERSEKATVTEPQDSPALSTETSPIVKKPLDGVSTVATHSPETAAPSVQKSSPELRPVPAAPSVRRLVRELGADIYQIVGTGPDNRISIEDVKAHVKGLLQKQSGPGPAVIAPAALPDFSRFGPIQREELSSIRQKTAQKMALAWHQIPHVTQFDEADITALEEFRQRKNKELRKEGGKLTVTAILLKVIASALHKFPKFNASLNMQQNQVIYKNYVHLGVAVDTPRGLLVPVVRNADQKDVFTIARELDDLAQRAREKKIRPEELQGSCLSLTNLGGLGTTYFTPIINWPEVAILGAGRAKLQTLLIGGALQARLILPLSLSYDHRIIDGADAARFLRWIAEALAYPLSL